MNDHGFGALLGLGIPACAIFIGAVVLLAKTKTLPALLQLIGAGGLITVVIAHIGEAFSLLPSMQWGIEHSVGHYLDLGAATIGLMLFPAGYLAYALAKPPLDNSHIRGGRPSHVVHQ